MNHTYRAAAASCLIAGCVALLPVHAFAEAAPPAGPATVAPPPLPAPLPPPPLAPSPPTPAPVVVHTVVPEPPPVVEPAVAPAPKREDEGAPDHERFVGHFGVKYFDVTALPIANPVPVTGSGAPQPGAGTSTPITSSTISAPVLGVRYWLKGSLGIDVGLGIGLGGGRQEAVNGAVGTDSKAEKTGTWGLALHGGLPIALYRGRHYSVLVIPGFTVGGSGGTYKPPSVGGAPAAPQQDLSGFLFDIGAQTGAEIHFGFIGVPELALQATVGLSYRRTAYKWKSDVNSASDATDAFGTSVQADPWAIFTNSISATYYF
jgi:hypothetical protein